MLSLRAALESALVANPDDRATHSAYADYLQEQGDPRGEFIQLQLAQEDPRRSLEQLHSLQRRIEELLRDHEREWLGILADELLGPPGDLDLASLDFPSAASEHGFARGWLDRIALPDNPECERRTELGRLLCLAPETRLLRELILEYDEGLVDSLCTSSFLGNLRVLQLGRPLRGFADLAWMADAFSLPELIAQLPRIEELRLYAHGYDATRLFSLPNLSSLRVLQVHYLAGRYPLETLADNPALGQLTHLLLHPRPFAESDVDLAGVRALVQSPHLARLTHLQLHCSDLGDVGCTEIVTSGILKRLKVLDLRHGEITDAGASILANCPDLQRLELLDVERNGLTQTGIDVLRRVLGSALRADDQQTPAELADRQYLYETDWA